MSRTEELIILGAGASRAEGAPSQNELFEHFFEQIAKQSPSGRGRYKNRINNINQYFSDFWGIQPYECGVQYPTIEECLGVLDIAFNRNESIRGYSPQRIAETRNNLVFLIAKVLRDKLQNGKENHENLVRRLGKEGELKSTAFLSLNYDIVIDNTLTDLKRVFDIDIDYGIDIIKYPKNGSRNRDLDWTEPREDKSTKLFKIHGSLNWLYCTTCNQMTITPFEKGGYDTFKSEKKCSYCDTPLQPVIIPPTYFKEFSNPYIQQVFLKADQTIRSVSKIYVCGYSFSDADIHVKYLLKRAELFSNNTPKIYIINHHENKSKSQILEEKHRFTRFFRNKDNVHSTELSFQEFCKYGVEDEN